MAKEGKRKNKRREKKMGKEGGIKKGWREDIYAESRGRERRKKEGRSMGDMIYIIYRRKDDEEKEKYKASEKSI